MNAGQSMDSSVMSVKNRKSHNCLIQTIVVPGFSGRQDVSSRSANREVFRSYVLFDYVFIRQIILPVNAQMHKISAIECHLSQIHIDMPPVYLYIFIIDELPRA